MKYLKRTLLGVLLSIPILLGCTDTVKASNDVDYTQYEFENFQNPEELKNKAFFSEDSFTMDFDEETLEYSNAKIYESFYVDENYGYIFNINSGTYKYLQYDVMSDGSTYLHWLSYRYNDDNSVMTYWYKGGDGLYTYKPSNYEDYLSYKNTVCSYNTEYDLDTILSKAENISGDFMHWFKHWNGNSCNSYILVFKKDASTLDDLLYVLSMNDLTPYVYNFMVDPREPVSEPVLSIEVIDAVDKKDPSKGFNMKFNYEFFGISTKIEAVDLEYPRSLHIKDIDFYLPIDTTLVKDSSYFILPALDSNYTYNCSIETDRGNTYDFTFKTGDLRTLFDLEEGEDYDNTIPTLTFSNIPDSIEYGKSFILDISSDVSVMLNFNGTILGNNAYLKNFKTEITENGTYMFMAVSESGVEATQVLEITCFTDKSDGGKEDEDLPPDIDDEDDELFQTGIFSSNRIWLILVAVGVVCLSIAGTIYFKRRYDNAKKI